MQSAVISEDIQIAFSRHRLMSQPSPTDASLTSAQSGQIRDQLLLRLRLRLSTA